jgi:hypothetical protein
MFEFLIEKSEKDIECPMCGYQVKKGDNLYYDNYRYECVCGNCLEDYKSEVISEEGIDGRLLK